MQLSYFFCQKILSFCGGKRKLKRNVELVNKTYIG